MYFSGVQPVEIVNSITFIVSVYVLALFAFLFMYLRGSNVIGSFIVMVAASPTALVYFASKHFAEGANQDYEAMFTISAAVYAFVAAAWVWSLWCNLDYMYQDRSDEDVVFDENIDEVVKGAGCVVKHRWDFTDDVDGIMKDCPFDGSYGYIVYDGENFLDEEYVYSEDDLHYFVDFLSCSKSADLRVQYANLVFSDCDKLEESYTIYNTCENPDGEPTETRNIRVTIFKI